MTQWYLDPQEETVEKKNREQSRNHKRERSLNKSIANLKTLQTQKRLPTKNP